MLKFEEVVQCSDVTMAYKSYESQDEKINMIRMLVNEPGLQGKIDLDLELALTLKLCQLFPGLPDDIAMRLVPNLDFLKNEDIGQLVPWNRRKRRRLAKAKNIALHIFAGPDPQWWEKQLSDNETEVLCVDIEGHGVKANLLDPYVFGYLLQLAASGKVRVILGGPPCRTVSALRFQGDEGPRPVRTDECPYGVADLNPQEQEMVEQDVLLMHRYLALFVLAEQVRQPEESPTQLVLEQPEDPARYRYLLQMWRSMGTCLHFAPKPGDTSKNSMAFSWFTLTRLPWATAGESQQRWRPT